MHNTIFDVPLNQRLIGIFLEEQSVIRGDKTFLEFENSSWTFSQVKQQSFQVAKGLLKLNTKPQTSVLVL